MRAYHDGLLAIVLFVAGPFLAGCDAGSRVRIHAESPAGWMSSEGDALRVFWFDDAEDDLFSAPVEEQVRRAGEERAHGTRHGLYQRDWITVPLDGEGRAVVDVKTFYAGALLLPLENLLFGSREGDPEGLWFEVLHGGTGDRQVQGLVVRRLDGEPVLVRVAHVNGGNTSGERCGAVEKVRGGGDDPGGWRMVLPLLP